MEIANELRVGNYVYADIGLAFPEIHELLLADFSALADGRLDGLISRIPLTEGLVQKLGFKKWKVKNKEITYSNKHVILHLRKRGWIINTRTVQVMYVHQLQNIQFSNKGIELKFKY